MVCCHTSKLSAELWDFLVQYMLLHVQNCLAGPGALLHMHGSIVCQQFAYWVEILAYGQWCCCVDEQVHQVRKYDV